MLLTVITPTADILGEPQSPNIISNADSQLLYGETFEFLESRGAYVKGRSTLDGYEGFVERDQLIKEALHSNSLVTAPSTHLYPEPSFKSRPLMALSIMSRFHATAEEKDGFVKTVDGWIFKEHIQHQSKLNLGMDLADAALLYYNTPYLFAGRSKFGIDCSGLIQMAMIACGFDCPPRDSKDQKGSIGEEVSKEQIQRNDLVYFKGHVGIMMDEKHILNATARFMSTLIEPLNVLEDAYGDILSIRRLPCA